MAERLSFDIAGRDAGASRVLLDVGDAASVAAQGARLLAESLEAQGKSAAVSAGATLALAKADKILADAEHVLSGETAAAGGKLTLFSRAAFGAGRALSGLGGPGGAATGANIALGGVAGVLAAIVLPLDGMIASLASLAAGTIGFAVIATSEWEKISAAVTKGGAAWKALTPAEKAVGDQLKGLQGQFASLAKAVRPEVLQAFASALDILRRLFPLLKPLVEAAGKALDFFLGQMDSWLKSDSGQKFIAWMKTEGPKTFMDLARIAWDMANVIGRAFWFLQQAHNKWWESFHAAVGSFEQAGRNLVQWFGNDFAARLVTFFTRTIPAAFDALPDRMLDALAGLPAMLFALGRRAIEAFLHGLESLGSGIWHFLFGGGGSGGAAGGGPAQGIAAAMLPGFGFSAGEIAPLTLLWNRESGWNRFARNPSSGAYGIPQALPESKLPFAGQAAGGSSATAQIGWGLGYIKGRYGTPSGAWRHETAFGWYDQGGWLPTGASVAVNTTGRPERVGGGDTYIINVNVPPGAVMTNPRATAKTLADILNQGATAGVRLRKSILSANG